jgi:hypothetical protein
MRRIRHYVASQRFHKGDAWILAAAGTVLPQLVIRLGLECNAEPLDADRVTGRTETDARYPDARVVALRD